MIGIIHWLIEIEHRKYNLFYRIYLGKSSKIWIKIKCWFLLWKKYFNIFNFFRIDLNFCVIKYLLYVITHCREPNFLTHNKITLRLILNKFSRNLKNLHIFNPLIYIYLYKFSEQLYTIINTYILIHWLLMKRNT